MCQSLMSLKKQHNNNVTHKNRLINNGIILRNHYTVTKFTLNIILMFCKYLKLCYSI